MFFDVCSARFMDITSEDEAEVLRSFDDLTNVSNLQGWRWTFEI